MELGQIFHNNPTGYNCPLFVEALLREIKTQIARAYWNVNQKPWKGAALGDIGRDVEWWSEEYAELSYYPGIPGIEWRPYYNWSGCPDDDDWNQDEADKPNFSFEGVEFRWYKNFGRSMNVNVDWPPTKWRLWFDRTIQTIKAWESENCKIHLGHRLPYPNPGGIVPLNNERN